MSFVTYYELKDKNKLPPGAAYFEPRNNEKILVNPSETFDQFTDRIKKYRTSKGYPELSPTELEILLITSLEATTSSTVKSTYFQPLAYVPSMAQGIQLAKTLIQQVGKNQAPFDVREERANKCLKCPIHRPGTASTNTVRIVSSALNVVSKGENLKDLDSSKSQDAVGSCGACGCVLTNKIRVDLLSAIMSLEIPQIDFILRVFGEKVFGPEGCWMFGEAIENHHYKDLLVQKMKSARSRGDILLSSYTKNKIAEAK